MKKTILRFYKRNEKRNDKLLKKMFGCNLVEAIKLEEQIRFDLEKSLGKDVDNIRYSDVQEKSFLRYTYIKYKTLRAVIDLIMDNRLVYSISQDYLEESK